MFSKSKKYFIIPGFTHPSVYVKILFTYFKSNIIFNIIGKSSIIINYWFKFKGQVNHE